MVDIHDIELLGRMVVSSLALRPFWFDDRRRSCDLQPVLGDPWREPSNVLFLYVYKGISSPQYFASTRTAKWINFVLVQVTPPSSKYSLVIHRLNFVPVKVLFESCDPHNEHSVWFELTRNLIIYILYDNLHIARVNII